MMVESYEQLLDLVRQVQPENKWIPRAIIRVKRGTAKAGTMQTIANYLSHLLNENVTIEIKRE